MENFEQKLVHSVGEAENIAKLMIIQGDIDGLYGLKEIVSTGTVRGSSNDFHNFCVNFAARGDYESACDLLEIGLQQNKTSTDLLADYLQYGIKCGREEKCEEYYRQLNDIPKGRWTWRSFDFAIDYLTALASELTEEEAIQRKKQEMLAIATEFQNRFPYDEQPHKAMVDIYEFFGLRAEMIDTLKSAMSSVKVSPKCCLKYADLMLEQGSYTEVIVAAKQGIVAAAQEQPTVNLGYLFYLSALAKDALIHEGEQFDNLQMIQDAFADYRIAETLFDEGSTAYMGMIKDRTFVLETKSGIAYKNTNIKAMPS